MIPRASLLVVLVVVLSACGPARPPLSASSLSLTVERRANLVTEVSVVLEDASDACGRLDATATVNGVPLALVEDGTKDHGTYYFLPVPGCYPPRFALAGDSARALTGPFELVIEASGERVVVRSEALLTRDYTATVDATAGGTLRLSPTGDFAPPTSVSSLDVWGPELEEDSADSMALQQKKRDWKRWNTRIEGQAIIADIPADLPAGTYNWLADELWLGAPIERCEGVSGCSALLFLDVTGKVTVSR